MRISNRRTMTGTVTSDKMQKSCTVRVERRYKHPKYGKYVVASKKYIVHDENNEARVGDHVEMSETRPLSKNKRWRLQSVIDRSDTGGAQKSVASESVASESGTSEPGTSESGTSESGEAKS